MRIDDKDDASETAGQTPPVANKQNVKPPAFPENDIARVEKEVVDDEVAVLLREKLVAIREYATHIRENTDSRGETESPRDGDIRAIEKTQAAVRSQIMALQQTNANLVLASIEALKLAEKVQTARVHLDHLAYHDVLTDLPNRILLQDRLKQAIELARRQSRKLVVMFMDLDRFKHINDSLGHAVGDQLLQMVAQRLLGCVRNSDTISRQGGDEFVLLLPYIAHAQDAALTAQKMLSALSLPYVIDRHNLHISVSIGISIYPDDGRDAKTLIKNADTAMYDAKENGRNHFKFFEPSMDVRAIQRQYTQASLHRALERQEFLLHYQPKVNLRTGAIVGVEALIRWQHPERGLLLASQFVPIAEDCGLMLPIGRWVLREACMQARSWKRAGLPPIRIAINTSAVEFGAEDFVKNIRSTIEDPSLELDPNYLELELSESILTRDAKSTDSILQSLTRLGLKLAVDDFGSGYFRLNYLRKSPIATLKIDQSFVNGMTTNPDDATIVSTVISMGKNLKKRVIAEGVETPQHHAFLLAHQCDEGQGYYFCRPIAADAVAALLQTGELLTPQA